MNPNIALALILLGSSIISCNDRTKEEYKSPYNNFNFISMDTNSLDPQLKAQHAKYNRLAYEDINLSERVGLVYVPKETIYKNGIKTVILQHINEERYDAWGSRIYLKYDSWTGEETFSYNYHANGSPNYLVSFLDTIIYTYDAQNRLIKCGEKIIQYYPNGFKKSVETPYETEYYQYDNKGNLCYIEIEAKPDANYICGIGMLQWHGRYDENNRLFEQYAESNQINPKISRYIYNDEGDIVKEINYNTHPEDSTFYHYIYKDSTVIIQNRTNDYSTLGNF